MKQFNEIYQAYYHKAVRFANLYVRNDLIAEDIATEAMIKLWEVMKKEPVKTPDSLLLTILKNKSLDHLKMHANERKACDAMEEWHYRELKIRISTLEACAPERIFSDEIQSIMAKTLNKLPHQTQRVFRMSRFESKSGKDIAAELGITVKGVDYHIAKALKVLRIALKDYLLSCFLYLTLLFSI